MKKAIYLLSVFFCIIAISACQPTPEKEIVVHKAAEQLEATPVSYTHLTLPTKLEV